MENRSEHERITLRIPPALHKKLVRAAGSNSPAKSLNTEILERLYRSFEPPAQVLAPLPGKTLEERYENAARAWMLTVQELQARVAELEKRQGETDND